LFFDTTSRFFSRWMRKVAVLMSIHRLVMKNLKVVSKNKGHTTVYPPQGMTFSRI